MGLLGKAIVLYESRYGNTKRIAESIIEGIREVEGIETVLSELKVDLDNIVNYDAILIGSPNHFGGPTRGVRKFIDKLAKLSMKGKQLAVFDTYIGKDFEKAVKKMEENKRKGSWIETDSSWIINKSSRDERSNFRGGSFPNAKSSERK